MSQKENRELMVVLRAAKSDSSFLEAETAWLNFILNRVETHKNVAACSELLNLNRNRIEERYEKVFSFLNAPKPRPFIFLFNKN